MKDTDKEAVEPAMTKVELRLFWFRTLSVYEGLGIWVRD